MTTARTERFADWAWKLNRADELILIDACASTSAAHALPVGPRHRQDGTRIAASDPMGSDGVRQA